MADLILYADRGFESPWVFHAMVALEELKLRYTLEMLPLPIPPDRRAALEQHALLGKVPCLVHGDFWLTESSAISEYLTEQFPPPGHVPLLPADARERARARQVMSWLRTSLMGLRSDRPTTSVFRRPVTTPMSDKGKADAADLIRIASGLLAHDRPTLFSTWSIADADLALTLMRLVANSEHVPELLHDYALAQWGRASVRKYLGYIPTTP